MASNLAKVENARFAPQNGRSADHSLEELSLPNARMSLKSEPTNSANVSYKHPVSNFDFVSSSGENYSISAIGLRERESRVDTTGTIRVTNMGVTSDQGWKFKVELASTEQFSMSTSAGDKKYSSHLIQKSPDSEARKVYELYSALYTASKSETDIDSHLNAVNSLKKYAGNIGPDVAASIKSWASATSSLEEKKFFQRLANSLG